MHYDWIVADNTSCDWKIISIDKFNLSLSISNLIFTSQARYNIKLGKEIRTHRLCYNVTKR